MIANRDECIQAIWTESQIAKLLLHASRAEPHPLTHTHTHGDRISCHAHKQPPTHRHRHWHRHRYRYRHRHTWKDWDVRDICIYIYTPAS